MGQRQKQININQQTINQQKQNFSSSLGSLKEKSLNSLREKVINATSSVLEGVNMKPKEEEPKEVRIIGPVSMSLGRPELPELTPDKALWVLIRDRTNAISFKQYENFMNGVMYNLPTSPVIQQKNTPLNSLSSTLSSNDKLNELKGKWQDLKYRGLDAYELLKKSTEAFLMQECGRLSDKEWGPTKPEEEMSRLPQLKVKTEGATSDEIDEIKKTISDEIKTNKDEYLKQLGGELQAFPYVKVILAKLGELPLKNVVPPSYYGILRSRVSEPCLIELIWSYWHEESMLAQTMKVISLRFQNRRLHAPDPLAHLDIDPLRPISNLLWGYIQDEQHRLTVARRAYEYDHHYGIRLYGKAVPQLRPADSRSKFLEAFHNLLYLCLVFYKDEADTTVIPDGFPVLNALKEVHLLLAQGAHNQFGDLPWTSRVEMLMEQWLLARPEMREFLGGRIMVPYPEPWMERVDTMKKLQGWTNVTVTHFRDCGIFGEQILLSVRYGNWVDVNNEAQARIWAHYWKPEIQGYIHAYRAITGVDLTVEATEPYQVSLRHTQPSLLLRQRLAKQVTR